MAIELYYTLASEKPPRKWYDPFVSCRGSMATFFAFMMYMEKKYLPSLPPIVPITKNDDFYHSRWSRTLTWEVGTEHPMQEVWDLQLSPNTTHEERLTMESMMDRGYFIVSDFSKIESAWLEVAAEMNNTDSDEAFRGLITTIHKVIHKIPGIHSIAINWTSVASFYETYGKTDKKCYDLVADNIKIESQFKETKG